MSHTRFTTLIVKGTGHIEMAAFAVEQAERVCEEIGVLEVFIGFSPWKIKFCQARTESEQYATSYYWDKFTRIPQFVEKARPSLVLYLTTALKTALSVGLALGRAILTSVLTLKTVAFFESLKLQCMRDILIGPAILSDYLRSERYSKGYLRLDWGFFVTVCLCHFYTHYWLDVCGHLDFSRILFLNQETTYRDEAVRLALLRRGASEVYSDRWNYGKLVISNSHSTGMQTMLCSPSNRIPSMVESEQVVQGIQSRLRGESSYPYMGCDVESNVTLSFMKGINVSGSEQRPKAVIFLHAVGDAQHFFGTDCFADLNQWLFASIEMLLDKHYSVYLKMHPCYYETGIKGADQRYKKYLERRLRASWDDLTPGAITRTGLDDNLYVMDYRAHVHSIRAFFGGFLCLTHHGTIAIEATALTIPVICSEANPFQHFPSFAWTYRTLTQYQDLLVQYMQGKLRVTNTHLQNMYSYLYESRRDNWHWIFNEYTKLCGHNFVKEPNRFIDWLLSVHPSFNHEMYLQARNVFGSRRDKTYQAEPQTFPAAKVSG
jgi:hypothetical protein